MKKFRYNTTTFLIDEARTWDFPDAKAGFALAEDPGDDAAPGMYYEGGQVRGPNATEVKIQYQQNRQKYIETRMPIHKQVEALREKLMEGKDAKADDLQTIITAARSEFPPPT